MLIAKRRKKGNYTADKVFDLQESTYWKTVDKISYPHQIVIDLGEKQKITDFRYLPRAEKVLRDKSESIKYIYQTVFKLFR